MCYSTTQGTVHKRSMAFAGVVKPSPWPGLQANPPFAQPALPSPIWHHSHPGDYRNNEAMARGGGEMNSVHSATTHFKLLPPSHHPARRYDLTIVSGSDNRQQVAPGNGGVYSQAPRPPSPKRQRSLEERDSKPVPVSSEIPVPSAAASPFPLVDACGVARAVSGERGVNEEAAGLLRNLSHGALPSPTHPGKKKGVRRRRCGSCAGCTRRENCGCCSVCTNSNATNTVCKLKRCEALKKRWPASPGVGGAFSPYMLPGESPRADQASPVSSPLTGPTHSRTSLLVGSPVKDEEIRESPPVKKKRGGSSYRTPPVKEPLPCGCPGSDDGFYYTHLGAGSSPTDLRDKMEKRFSVGGKELRMYELTFTGVEAKTTNGCPTAEWIIRRTNEEEHFLVLYRHHKGHVCTSSYTVISIVLWDGLSKARTMQLYKQMTDILPRYGLPTSRRCESNETKSCACQGKDDDTSGCSYSFGCSWSVYYNGCKFAKSKVPRKFKLTDPPQEPVLEETFQRLASDLSPVYKWLAPDSFSNQVSTFEQGQECRLGRNDNGERPFSGVTCCMDFCAHSHYDRHNMTDGGATVVCTILRRGVFEEHSEDDQSEQLHVLPLYRLRDAPDHSVPGIEVRPVDYASYSNATTSKTPTKSYSKTEDPKPPTIPLPSPSHKLNGWSPVLPMSGQLSHHQPNGFKFPHFNGWLAGEDRTCTAVSTSPTPANISINNHQRPPMLSPLLQQPHLTTELPHPPPASPNAAATTVTSASESEGLLQCRQLQTTLSTISEDSGLGMTPTSGSSPPYTSSPEADGGVSSSPEEARASETPAISLSSSQSLQHGIDVSTTSVVGGKNRVVRDPDVHPVHKTVAQGRQASADPASSCSGNVKVLPNGFVMQANPTLQDGHTSWSSYSSSTDSDSDCYILTDSPTLSQDSPVPLPNSAVKPSNGFVPRPNGVHIKSELPDMATFYHHKNGLRMPSFGPPSPGCASFGRVASPTSLNGLMHHQLQKSMVSPSPAHEPGFSASHTVVKSELLASPFPYPPPQSPLTATPSTAPPTSFDEAKKEEQDEVKMSISAGRMHAIPGGVAIALGHGSILIECAKKELHATTPIPKPSRKMPTRISMVFYQHKRMTLRNHGWYEEEEKARKRQEENERQRALKAQEEMLNNPGITEFNPPAPLARGGLGLREGLPICTPIHPRMGRPASLSLDCPLPALFSSRLRKRTFEDTFDVSSDECSDNLDPILPLACNSPAEVPPTVVRGVVPRAVPLSEKNSPFYLSLPIKKVDVTTINRPPLSLPLQKSPYLGPQQPRELLSTPTFGTSTNSTPTLCMSACKCSTLLSGNYTISKPC